MFKSHGSADAFAFEQALNRAYDAARNRLLDRVHDRILETLAAMPASAADAADRSAGTGRITMSTDHTALLAHHRHRQLPAAATGVTNEELAAQLARDGVETSDDWIVERTGIRARHFAAPDVTCSDLAVARRAPRARGRRPQRRATIDLIIVATSTPDMVFPSTACIVQRKLGVARLRRPSTCRRCAPASSTR